VKQNPPQKGSPKPLRFPSAHQLGMHTNVSMRSSLFSTRLAFGRSARPRPRPRDFRAGLSRYRRTSPPSIWFALHRRTQIALSTVRQSPSTSCRPVLAKERTTVMGSHYSHNGSTSAGSLPCHDRCALKTEAHFTKPEIAGRTLNLSCTMRRIGHGSSTLGRTRFMFRTEHEKAPQGVPPHD